MSDAQFPQSEQSEAQTAKPASASTPTATHPTPQEDQTDSDLRTADPATEYTVIRKTSIASAAASGAAPWPVWLCAYTGTSTSLSPALPPPAMQPAFARNEPAHASQRLRLVAVKTPASRHEIAVLRSLSHEGIVRFYDAFADNAGNAVLHLVMEPMEGSARQLLKARRGRPLAPPLLADMGRQLGGALAFVHAAGWAHRDLGAESALVTTLGLANWSWTGAGAAMVDVDVVAQVKLGGFAHACRSDGVKSQSQPQWQTPLQYRAPEDTSGSSQPAADVWALGALLAELTMLRPLFPVHASTREEVHWASVRDTVLPDDKAADKLALDFPNPTTPASRDWAECVARLLRYDPNTRISAAQMLELPALTRPYNKAMRPDPPKP